MTAIVLLGITGFGFYAQGISGAVIMLVTFGVLCFIWYAASDGIKAVDNYIKQPRQMDVTIHQGDATKGQEYPDVEGRAWRENPDPTRPTDEDWAGLITYKIEKARRK